MTATKSFFFLVLLLWLVSCVVACTPKSHGIVRAQRSYDDVFRASLAAVQEAAFTVTSQNLEKGTIAAQKQLTTAEGNLMRLKVRLHQEPTGITVVATVGRPLGTLAADEKPCKCHLKRFVQALENRLPDVQVVSIQ